MVFDSQIIDFLEACEPIDFRGAVFRATRRNLDPLAPSTAGGRWMIPQRFSVLYTSTTKLGAIAEITFHWGLLTPPPTKSAVIHELLVSARKSVRIQRGDFAKLGISLEQFGDRGYARTQEIGAAVAFLGFDGLFVPSARSTAENFVLLHDNHQPDLELDLVSSEEIALTLPPQAE